MKITVYGIPNCDTVKKARAWLDEHGVDYEFHDYKKAGITRAKLEAWMKKENWEALLNRAGSTFRKLPESARTDVDQRKAIDLMLAQPSMIKRPVLEHGATLIVGFNAGKYSAL